MGYNPLFYLHAADRFSCDIVSVTRVTSYMYFFREVQILIFSADFFQFHTYTSLSSIEKYKAYYNYDVE